MTWRCPIETLRKRTLYAGGRKARSAASRLWDATEPKLTNFHNVSIYLNGVMVLDGVTMTISYDE